MSRKLMQQALDALTDEVPTSFKRNLLNGLKAALALPEAKPEVPVASSGPNGTVWTAADVTRLDIALHEHFGTPDPRIAKPAPESQLTWPERIWLQHGDEEIPAYISLTSEITWCVDHIENADVPYIRADLADPDPRIAELTAQLAEVAAVARAFKEECDLRQHMVITCGVAASHPNAGLSRTGAYADKWNSAQAEDVRKLRDEREALKGQLVKLDHLSAVLAHSVLKIHKAVGLPEDAIVDSEVIIEAIAALTAERDALKAKPAVAPDDSALTDAIAEQLSGLYYCGRVWSAWGVGTMTQDDFTEASEISDVVDNLVAAVKSVLVTQPAAVQGAPAGWQLVPKTMTGDQHKAVLNCHLGYSYPQDVVQGPRAMREQEYRASLAAAPQPGEPA